MVQLFQDFSVCILGVEILLAGLLAWCPRLNAQIPITTRTWDLLIGQGNTKWTPRNGEFIPLNKGVASYL
jgi:hypothetical protein